MDYKKYERGLVEKKTIKEKENTAEIGKQMK